MHGSLVGLMDELSCGTEVVDSAFDRGLLAPWADANEKKAGRGGQIRDKHMRPVGDWSKASKRRNRRDSGPRSPAKTLSPAPLPPIGLEPPPAKPAHRHPPIPHFKIPPAQWPIVLQRVAQGESLRQIARSYHTSHEAVRRVLNASRKGLLAGQGEPATLPPEDADEASTKE